MTRRLPEKEREEVGRELTANICDMLPEAADEGQVEAVLRSLGAPALLAGRYRQGPGYLISPAVHGDYLRTLKWVVPLVGAVVLAVGLVTGAVEVLASGPASFTAIFSRGISMGVSAAFQALVWVTVGFAIADRAGHKAGRGDEGWDVKNLPQLPPGGKGGIALSDSVTGLALTVIFTVLGVLWCSGTLPVLIFRLGSGMRIYHIFSAEFMAGCVPAVIAMGELGVCEYAVKIARRRWTPLVCAVVIGSNLASAGIALFLLGRPNLLDPEFAAYIRDVEWGSFDLMRLLAPGAGNPVVVIAAAIVAAALAGCGVAVYRTVRAGRG